ncbi:MAG: cupredoxin domain-containing protein [Candidatus Entotheonellia bacterium]
MKQLGYLSIVLLMLGWLPAALPEGSAPVNIAAAQPADMAPRTVTVQTGAGQDTVDLLAFLPEKVRIRVGDTVTWKMEGDIHTVSFTTGTKPAGLVIPSSQAAPGEVIPRVFLPVPGAPQGVNMMNPALVFPTRKADQPLEQHSGTGFVSSGMMSNATLFPGTPPIQTFSVTFDTPGTFQYVCLLHQEFGMRGTVEVTPVTAIDVPTQADIDARAQQELATLKVLLEQAKSQGRQGRSEPGPHNTKLWRVLAGNSLVDINDGRVQLLEFVPKDVTIQAGDTIIWESRFFHSVTFVPTPPPPDRFLPERQPDGAVQLIRNPVIFNIARPAGVFDPAQVFNSGTIGTFPGPGITYALTFETPGIFKYFCGIHRDQGMEGTIIVQPRQARIP